MELNRIQKEYIAKKLQALQHSKFRSSFHLRKYMNSYIDQKGMPLIEKHCEAFIEKNLNNITLSKDGQQTPMKNHPVFIAQHATATCCRSCLEKWHHIPKNRNLTEKEKRYIKALIITWIEKERRDKNETRISSENN